MKVVILCGGMGARMKEETEFKPKPLVKIGDKPILWHIMKIYSHYGFSDFILCLGYKGEMIKEYFLNYDCMNNDFTIDLGCKNQVKFYGNHCESDWSVTLADTGLETNTGGRIKKIQKYVDGETFLATYGDAVGDVNTKKLIEFHKSKGKTATITAVHPLSRYGVVEADDDNIVKGFKEKPRLGGWINAGFFVFNKDIFRYLKEDSVLETAPLETLSEKREVAVYHHGGFWQCMDTFKDSELLNRIWNSDNVPWRVWK